MRLFVAIDLDDEVREAVTELMADLKRAAPDLRWVRPEAMHLTLKFIGHADEGRLEPIKQALAQVKAGTPAELQYRGVGFLPNEKRPRVLFLAISANPVLEELAQKIEESLSMLGIERETRAFRAHLTLARFRKERSRDLERLRERLKELAAEMLSWEREFARDTIREFHLYQSQLSPQGAKYTRLERFEFVSAPGE